METATAPAGSTRGNERPVTVAIASRAGLAFVFLLFGWEKLGHPESWIVYLAPSLARALDYIGLTSGQFFHGLALFELLIGSLLALGWRTRAAASLAAGELLAIVATVGLDHTGIRDLGLLLGAALPLAGTKPDAWTLDQWWSHGTPATKGMNSRVHRAAATAVLVGAVAAVALFATRRDSVEPALPPDSPTPLVALARSPVTGRREPIHPIPESLEVHPGKADLGRRLFHDPRLSGDESISCASCHALDQGGDDGRARSKGIGGREGAVNAPTVLNAAFNVHQFWDGRAADLRAQAADPVTSPIEMGGSWPDILAKLNRDESYHRAFSTLYGPRALTPQNVADAIAEFERTLVTPGGRFDRWLGGDDSALSASELAGYRLFKEIGCIACHQGVNVGGNMFQTMGKFGDYFNDRGGPVTTADLGRYNVTRREIDRHKFKVPGLRNVELTAPYFHDGSTRTLEEAVNTMARYQLGRTLQPAETGLIVQFLKTLTGTAPANGTP